MIIDQKKRTKYLISETKKMWSEIGIDINFQIGAELLQVFSRDMIFNLRQSENCSQLGYFSRDLNRWKILNLIINRGAKGETFYKSKIIKYLKMSSRSFDAIIKDAVNAGYFIYAEPMDKTKINKNIKNLRPSEKLIVEFTRYNIIRYKRAIKTFKKYGIK
tara:strand:+ start:89 stop:571 length:483 start_codon:yes stop_codon:yes gene_type:complete